jgi:predicted TIM-barrel fold metal-dependent hydrolase
MKIFDSLTHPTVNGKWISGNADCSFASLIRDMDEAKIDRACAVGLDGVGGFEYVKFAESVYNYRDRLVPIAAVNPLTEPNPDLLCQKLIELQYRGIKIHPRLSKLNFQRDFIALRRLCKAAGQVGLIVFLCTYYACHASDFPEYDQLPAISNLVGNCGDTRFVLLHGGSVRVLEYAELVRFNENLLLDLSLTLMKYEGSSIDNDIRFLCHNFDKRICVGSDHPEWSLVRFRSRVESFCNGLPSEKVERIGHNNITRFLGL